MVHDGKEKAWRTSQSETTEGQDSAAEPVIITLRLSCLTW